MNDFAFVYGLTTLHKLMDGKENTYGSLGAIKYLIHLLKTEYLFKVDYLVEDHLKAYTIYVKLQKGCSDIQKEWIYEIVDYYKPIGIRLEVA